MRQMLCKKQWRHGTKVCSFLRDHRIGDNYDFSVYQEIIGVVCTPVVVYVPLGLATADIAEGLFAAVSISELRIWLDGIRLGPGDQRTQFLRAVSKGVPKQRLRWSVDQRGPLLTKADRVYFWETGYELYLAKKHSRSAEVSASEPAASSSIAL